MRAVARLRQVAAGDAGEDEGRAIRRRTAARGARAARARPRARRCRRRAPRRAGEDGSSGCRAIAAGPRGDGHRPNGSRPVPWLARGSSEDRRGLHSRAMTTELAPAPAPIAEPAERPRIFSGIQPSGIAPPRQRPGRDPQLRAPAGRVRGDLLHRRLPRPDEHPRPGRPARPDPRDGGRRCWPSASTPSAARCSSRATGRSTPSWPGCSPRSRRSAGSSGRRPTRRRRPSSPTTSTTACSPTRSCRRPTSSSTRPHACRSARTRRRTSSCRARSSGPSTPATATRSRSRRRSSPRPRSSSARTASRR